MRDMPSPQVLVSNPLETVVETRFWGEGWRYPSTSMFRIRTLTIHISMREARDVCDMQERACQMGP